MIIDVVDVYPPIFFTTTSLNFMLSHTGLTWGQDEHLVLSPYRFSTHGPGQSGSGTGGCLAARPVRWSGCGTGL